MIGMQYFIDNLAPLKVEDAKTIRWWMLHIDSDKEESIASIVHYAPVYFYEYPVLLFLLKQDILYAEAEKAKQAVRRPSNTRGLPKYMTYQSQVNAARAINKELEIAADIVEIDGESLLTPKICLVNTLYHYIDLCKCLTYVGELNSEYEKPIFVSKTK